jgi:hypothetical protein
MDIHYVSKHLPKFNDFCTGNESLQELLQVIEKSLERWHGDDLHLGDNRLFFINPTTITYCDINFTPENELDGHPELITLEDGYSISSAVELTPEIRIMDGYPTIEEFCKHYIINDINPYHLDFKDRFTFIHFDQGVLKYLRPYKRFTDVFAHGYGEMTPFGTIDSPDFAWDI